jgi:hypothetical protein
VVLPALLRKLWVLLMVLWALPLLILFSLCLWSCPLLRCSTQLLLSCLLLLLHLSLMLLLIGHSLLAHAAVVVGQHGSLCHLRLTWPRCIGSLCLVFLA